MSDFGSASYGNNFSKTNYFKLKDGDSVFRILPPFGALIAQNRWSIFYNVHYGYKDSKGKMRMFQSPQVKNKQKMIEVPDAALERIQKLKAQLEEAKRTGNADLVQRLDKLVGQRGQFNLESKHFVNAMDLSGKVGILKLGHRAKLALDATIKTLTDQGIDPLSLENGRFFVFRRTGMGLDTSFQVTVYQEKIDVPGIGQVNRDLVSTISPAQAKMVAKECRDLSTLYKKLTADEVAQIVKEGSTAVDRIFATNNTATAEDYSDVEELGDDSDLTAAPSTPQTTTQATQVKAATTSTPVASAPVVQEARTAVANTAATTVSSLIPQSASTMSDEEFLASLNV